MYVMYEIQVCNVCLSVKHAYIVNVHHVGYVCMYVSRYVCMHVCMDVRTYIWYGMACYGIAWYGMLWYVMYVMLVMYVLYVTYAM